MEYHREHKEFDDQQERLYNNKKTEGMIKKFLFVGYFFCVSYKLALHRNIDWFLPKLDPRGLRQIFGDIRHEIETYPEQSVVRDCHAIDRSMIELKPLFIRTQNPTTTNFMRTENFLSEEIGNYFDTFLSSIDIITEK